MKTLWFFALSLFSSGLVAQGFSHQANMISLNKLQFEKEGYAVFEYPDGIDFSLNLEFSIAPSQEICCEGKVRVKIDPLPKLAYNDEFLNLEVKTSLAADFVNVRRMSGNLNCSFQESVMNFAKIAKWTQQIIKFYG